MLHNGDTIVMPWGYYDVENVLIETEGYDEQEQQLAMVRLALKFHEETGIDGWPVDDGDEGFHRQLLSDQLAMFARYDDLIPSFKDGADALLPFIAPMAQEMIENYLPKHYQGLEFKLTDHGYWAIVPDHDCVGLDMVCPNDPDPQSTYGLSDEQMAALADGDQVEI